MCGKCLFEAKFLEFAQPIAPVKKKRIVKKGTKVKKPNADVNNTLIREDVTTCLLDLISQIEAIYIAGDVLLTSSDIIVDNNDDKAMAVINVSGSDNNNDNGGDDTVQRYHQVIADTTVETKLIESVPIVINLLNNSTNENPIMSSQQEDALITGNDISQKTVFVDDATESLPNLSPTDIQQANNVMIKQAEQKQEIENEIEKETVIIHDTLSHQDNNHMKAPSRSHTFFSTWMSYFIGISNRVPMIWNVFLQSTFNPYTTTWMSRGISRLTFPNGDKKVG